MSFPTIGNARLDKITPVDVRRVLARMKSAEKSSTYRRDVFFAT